VIDWSLPELLTPVVFPISVFFSNWIYAVVMFPSLVLLTLNFPRPKPIFLRFRHPLVIFLYGFIPILTIIFDQIAEIGWVSVLTMALLSLALLTHSFFTTHDPVGQAQARWAVSGVVIMVLGIIPINLSGLGWLPFPFPLWLEEIWFPLLLVIMALGFGLAILRYRLFDIDIIINRALVYGALTLLVIGFYVLVVGYLGEMFRTETNLLISLIATGLVAVAFQPARERLQRTVDRLMFGHRDDPVGMLTQMAHQLERVDSPSSILPALIETIATALKLPYVSLLAKQSDGDYHGVAESGTPINPLIRIPLFYQQQDIGQLLVALRSPDERLSRADERLFTAVAPIVAAALKAVQLSEALRNSRRQIVTGREEERRRLRRDLHDGLGPVLASIVLQADTAGELVEEDSAEAKQLLSAIADQAQTAVADIRRLVYGMRPPALDELGLVKALMQMSKRGQNCVEVEAPDPFPSLPAAVEVAVFRITQEAINNAVNHGKAENCKVIIVVDEDDLTLTIIDDGMGMPEQPHSGVGLISMQERVAELEGTIAIESMPDRGTRIMVCLSLTGRIK
jgi:signal transduction histidine kinase